MNKHKHKLQLQWALLLTRWQRGRRAFDGRLMNERRLIVVAVICVIGLVMDNLFITPAYTQLNSAIKRKQAAQNAYQAVKAQADQQQARINAQQQEAQRELQNTREQVRRGQKALEDVQALLAPAKEMRQLLEGMLAQHGQLQLQSMTTLMPSEVSLGVGDGGSERVQLFKHGMEITVDGGFNDMLAWVISLERLPHRLMWDTLVLSADDQANLTMRVTVHTFSPDRATLEIAP